MELQGFRHAALSVIDLERSVAWYADVLGLTEFHRAQYPGRRVALVHDDTGSVMLGLCQFDDVDAGPFTPKRAGLDHLCLLVASRAELDSWAAALTEQGVEHSGVLSMATGPILNLTDPNGIPLALATAPTALADPARAGG